MNKISKVLFLSFVIWSLLCCAPPREPFKYTSKAIHAGPFGAYLLWHTWGEHAQ